MMRLCATSSSQLKSTTFEVKPLHLLKIETLPLIAHSLSPSKKNCTVEVSASLGLSKHELGTIQFLRHDKKCIQSWLTQHYMSSLLCPHAVHFCTEYCILFGHFSNINRASWQETMPGNE
jgi:hypothetical protein